MIDKQRHERLREEAQRHGSSVGEVVRRAIDAYLPDSAELRREAGRRLLAADPPPGPEPDWEVQKEQMLDELYGGPEDLK